MTTPRPGSRAEQRRRTEARILDAATQLFLTAGYERTTIRAVASAAGVDAGLVMHYFGSKQELYRRVIEAAPVPEVSGTPAEAAEQLLASLADLEREHEAGDVADEDYGPLRAGYVARAAEVLRELERLESSKPDRPGRDPGTARSLRRFLGRRRVRRSLVVLGCVCLVGISALQPHG